MTRLTEKQIDDRLIALHAALVDKLDEQPQYEPYLERRSGLSWTISIHDGKSKNWNVIFRAKGHTIEAALKAADALVAKMPTARDMKVHDFQKKLAEVIDEAEALSLPTDVVAPLREGSQALTNNLLAAE